MEGIVKNGVVNYAFILESVQKVQKGTFCVQYVVCSVTFLVYVV